MYASVSGVTVTAAVKKLKRKGYEVYSNRKILGTIGDFNSEIINDFTEETRKAIFRVARRFGFCKRKTIVSIDFHDKPFYGKKDTEGTVGTKRKLGTNFAYSYATICICEEGIRFNLATVSVTKLKLRKSIIRYLISEARKYVSIGLVLLDKGFNGVETSRLLDELRTKYAMPLINNKKIERVCMTSRKLTVMPYTYYENRPREYQKDILVMVDNRNKKKHLFTTNIKGDRRAVLSAIISAYRKR